MARKPTDYGRIVADYPPVGESTNQALERHTPIYREEYEGFKEDFLFWLARKGKNPFKGEGYAADTVRTTHYKIGRVYRWKCREAGEFSKDITPEDADFEVSFRRARSPTARCGTTIKALKRLFRWFNETRGTDHDWDYSKINQLRQKGASKRYHYFETREMEQLYDAAIEYSSIPSYHSVSPDEPDRVKQLLALRHTPCRRRRSVRRSSRKPTPGSTRRSSQ